MAKALNLDFFCEKITGSKISQNMLEKIVLKIIYAIFPDKITKKLKKNFIFNGHAIKDGGMFLSF